MKIKKFRLLFLAFVCLNLSVFAQKEKSKYVTIPFPSYPTELPVKDLEIYDVIFMDKAQLALPFNKEELDKGIDFESFSKSLNGESPDLLFAVNGVSVDDIKSEIKRSAINKEYSVSLWPKEGAKISVMLLIENKATQLINYPIKVMKNNEGEIIRETITFSFDDAETYLDFQDVDRAKHSPTLVKKFLKNYLGDNYLKGTFIAKLKERYDYGINKTGVKFFYIKDKKNKALKDESLEKINALNTTVFEKTNTLKELRKKKALLEPFNNYCKDLLETYKSSEKAAWGMLVNLNLTAMLVEDVALAEDYMNQIVALDTKTWATNSVKYRFNEFKKNYNQNHNEKGERLYAKEYTMNKTVAKALDNIEKDKKAKARDVNKEPGNVTFIDGEKLEGEVTLLFSRTENKEPGTMIDLDGGNQPGKIGEIWYKNKKGKTRLEYLKVKKVKEIVVGDKVYKPIETEKVKLGKIANALTVKFNNAIFMRELYTSDKIGVYKDERSEAKFHIKFAKDEKAKRLKAIANSFVDTMSELFKSCPSLVEKIKSGTLKNNEKDLVEIAKYFSNECE